MSFHLVFLVRWEGTTLFLLFKLRAKVEYYCYKVRVFQYTFRGCSLYGSCDDEKKLEGSPFVSYSVYLPLIF